MSRTQKTNERFRFKELESGACELFVLELSFGACDENHQHRQCRSVSSLILLIVCVFECETGSGAGCWFHHSFMAKRTLDSKVAVT